jgi:hypothetical protein
MGIELLQELQNWKLEAKLEDSERYFYEVAEVNSIRRGHKSFVIGRKGTGKTAIGERFLVKDRDDNAHSTKLSFKNFPFNELYNNKDTIYTRPNQFITIWKYIIYMSVCKLMRDNPKVNYTARAYCEKLIPTNDITSIARLIPRWVGKDFELKIFGSGRKVSVEKQAAVESTHWGSKVDILEKFILNEIDTSSYFVLFDELDEDYKDVLSRYQSNDYVDLITSLFKAVQDIRSIYRSNRQNIIPVIFIRNDIYELIQDSDKNKWSDLKVELNWDEAKIKNLLAFRISRAFNSAGAILPFTEAWDLIFRGGGVPVGHRQNRRKEIFQYIAGSTLLRPRDFVRYLQVAATAEIEKGHSVITPITVRTVDKAFSNYLRDEFVDEIHAVLPDINEILEILSQLRKQTMAINEFRLAYKDKLSGGQLKLADADLVLRILFHFSVIGNVGNKVTFFRYLNRDATLNFSERIAIHRGLYKSLQII